MIFLRIGFLEFLLVLHVIGSAVLFRRLFPRESPWLCFIVPILSLLAILNFIEHFIAMPNLGWLLPFTVGGLLWAVLTPGYSWEGLRYPSILFVVLFTFILFLKCLVPDVQNYCEGTGNLTRVLNYSLGGTLPPVDCFMPPYDYGCYYSFQHYGAAILKRLFSADLGTAYNLSFAFLLSWTCLIAAGVAHSISGKKWISLATVLVFLNGSSGSVPILILFGHGTDYSLSTCLEADYDNHDRNPFWWLCALSKNHSFVTLVSPTYSLYWPEFHATLGGTFITMAALLVCNEVLKPIKSDWPWIALFFLPLAALITSAWFFIIVTLICGGTFLIALAAGRRPQNIPMVVMLVAISMTLVWPAVFSLTSNNNSEIQSWSWTSAERITPIWVFLMQWWPIYIPWLFLTFRLSHLSLLGRWIYVAIPILLIFSELFTVGGNRTLTTEKLWGGTYGLGLVTLLPMVLMQKKISFRLLGFFLLAVLIYCLGWWQKVVFHDAVDLSHFACLQGDYNIQKDPQKRRLLQVLRRFHGETILPGRVEWAYNENPEIVTYSENRCFAAYTFQEWQAGHGGEIEYRGATTNMFYAGILSSPLEFLRCNDIAAVLIWPDDHISDATLQQMQSQIGSAYFYINCKMGGVNNAGVFVRQSVQPAPNTPPPSLDLAPPTNPPSNP